MDSFLILIVLTTRIDIMERSRQRRIPIWTSKINSHHDINLFTSSEVINKTMLLYNFEFVKCYDADLIRTSFEWEMILFLCN